MIAAVPGNRRQDLRLSHAPTLVTTPPLMKPRYPIFLLALIAAPSAFAQYWNQRADFPSTNYAPYGFSIGDRVFVGGGISGLAPFTEFPGLQEYLPASDQWVARTACPGPMRYGVAGFSINGKGYVVGGWSGSPPTALNDVWEYDPMADAWTQKNNFPGSARYSCVSVATSTKAYIGLGHATWLNDWWEYDPGQDSWTQRATLPGPGRAACGAFVINDEVYVTAGSRDVMNLTATFLLDLFRYSPDTDTWTALAPFPALGRSAPYSFTYGGLGYVMCGGGGDANSHDEYNDAWAYSPGTDQWYQLGLFPGVGMAGGLACCTSTTCYIGTGATGTASNSWVATEITAAFWEYHPTGLIGLDELQAGDGIRVVPSADGLLVQWPATARAQQLHLFDMGGRVVRTQTLNNNSGQALCSTGDLASGLYVVQVNGDGYAERVKVMVTR